MYGSLARPHAPMFIEVTFSFGVYVSSQAWCLPLRHYNRIAPTSDTCGESERADVSFFAQSPFRVQSPQIQRKKRRLKRPLGALARGYGFRRRNRHEKIGLQIGRASCRERV